MTALWELPGVTHWDGCGNSKRPEHSGCKIQPGVPLETTLWDEGYSVGVQDSMLRSTQIERVLTDLIAELRSLPAPMHRPGGLVAVIRVRGRASWQTWPTAEAATET